MRHSIHRCRRHTRLVARASRRRLSKERRAAYRVMGLMRKGVHGSELPPWTRSVGVVEGILRRFECRSVISGQTRGLVLVRVASHKGAEVWKSWDTVPVTRREALQLSAQTEQQRRETLCRGSLGDAIEAARRDFERCSLSSNVD
jgi:hypothetical protein